MKTWLCSLGLLIGGVMNAEDHPFRVMLLTGQSNHKWQATAPELASALKQSGRFDVAVVTTPPAGASAAAWQDCPLAFGTYQAVVMNWTDFGVKYGTNRSPMMRWMDDLVQFVRNGGGLVIVHAASLEHQPAWPEVAGLGWHDAKFGDRLTVNEKGEVVRTPKGQGPGSGHGARFEWDVTMRVTNHWICQGVAPVWHHAQDELWHGTRGPAANLEIIATGFSPITKANEPVMWTVSAGKGRVFVTLLGHDPIAMACPGFRKTLARGCEWVIAGTPP
jgi:uncharacterized protein